MQTYVCTIPFSPNEIKQLSLVVAGDSDDDDDDEE